MQGRHYDWSVNAARRSNRSRFAYRWASFVGLVALTLAACGGGDDASTASPEPATTESGQAGATDETAAAADATVAPAVVTETAPGTGEPVDGGDLKMTLQARVGLDPIKLANGSGGLGYSEFAAIYDTIVRWNNDTGEFEWRTGEFIPNEDFTVWTLKIKPGIKFQDGTDYNADAVMKHVERFVSPEASAGSKSLIIALLADMTSPDPLTVQFTLTSPWSGFPAPFTKELGMVPSPTQIEARGEDFGINPGPAGAGPFELVSYKPGEELVVKRNENYYGDKAHLDTITFSYVAGGDPALQLEALKNGEIDMMYTRDYFAIDDAKQDDDLYFASFTTVPGNGNLLFNALNVPTKARVASQLAIDPAAINDRVYRGLRPPSSEVFDKDFPYYPNVPGNPYDPEQAKVLVEEAKAEGWDGHMRVLGNTLKEQSELVQIVVAMLQAVGIDAEPQLVEPAQVGQLVALEKDFDMVVSYSYEMSTSPAETYNQLYKYWNEASPRFGYQSPDMTKGLNMLAEATTHDELVAAFKQIAEIWNRDVPSVVFGNSVAAYIGRTNVHGLELSTSEAGMFGDVWMDQG